MTKTYITKQKVTLELELMVDANTFEEAKQELVRGNWDSQHMYEANEFDKVIRVEDIQLIEVFE